MKSQTYITVSLLSPSSAGDQIQGLAYTGQVFSPLSHFLCPQKIIPGFYNAQFFFSKKGEFCFSVLGLGPMPHEFVREGLWH